MFALETAEYRGHCSRGYGEVKFVNQVLAKRNVKPKPACLVIDLEHGADLKLNRSSDKLTERTGTPKFIARSIASGSLLDGNEHESSSVRMPAMEGLLSDYRRFMHATEYLHGSSDLATGSDVKLAHQLFHDGESTFWVIAWLLAGSVGERSDNEPNPHAHFKKFFHTMYTHYPTPDDDSRSMLCIRSEEYWKSVLHPDLAALAPMLNQMHLYIRPEWAYRPRLNPEHVHEALMRLLLAEIVRIDEAGKDPIIELGGRSIPPAPEDMRLLSREHSRVSWG